MLRMHVTVTMSCCHQSKYIPFLFTNQAYYILITQWHLNHGLDAIA